MPEHLFVYGTLRRGCANHRQLRAAQYIDRAHTLHPCALYVDDYPYLNPNQPVGPVHGELYRVTPELLTQLDEFEGVPDLYTRARIAITTPDSAPILAWTYIRDSSAGRLLPHGDYLQSQPQPK